MFGIYRSQQAMTPLRETWEIATDRLRKAILLASHRIDRQLYKNPHKRGESRDGRTRILFQGPLAVTFEVDDTNKVVRILRAWVPANGQNGENRCG
jgi:hypothetical protein